MPDTARDLCSEALEELGVVQQGDALGDSDADLALRRYNRLLDVWNATRGAVYADQYVTNPLTAALSPHTIGPTGTWVVSQRPVSVDDAALVITGGSEDVLRQIWVRDQQWYDAQRVPSISTDYPTDVFYRPDWPNGSMFFYPVPSSTFDVRLRIRIVLAQVTLDTAFSLPPAYWRAHVLSLAEECAPSFGTQPSDSTIRAAAEARKVLFGANTPTPRLATRDLGVPRSGLGRRSFNWLDRSMR